MCMRPLLTTKLQWKLDLVIMNPLVGPRDGLQLPREEITKSGKHQNKNAVMDISYTMIPRNFLIFCLQVKEHWDVTVIRWLWPWIFDLQLFNLLYSGSVDIWEVKGTTWMRKWLREEHLLLHFSGSQVHLVVEVGSRENIYMSFIRHRTLLYLLKSFLSYLWGWGKVLLFTIQNMTMLYTICQNNYWLWETFLCIIFTGIK